MKKYHILLLSFFVFPPSINSAVTDNSEDLVVPAGETYSLDGSHSYAAGIRIDGILKVKAYTGTQGGTLELSAPSIYISSSGRITADGQGAGPDSGAGKPAPAAGCSHGAGAGHGGLGGTSGQASGGGVYGAVLSPAEFGSGGGSGVCGGASGGAGGGYLRLISGEIALYGVISSTGGTGGTAWCYACSSNGGGGGSGGTIRVDGGRVYGTGVITVGGGAASSYGGGGGSGGRIFMENVDLDSFTGSISAWGGKGPQPGGAGTIVVNGGLVVDNNGMAGAATVLPAGDYRLSGVSVKDRASVEIPRGVSIEAAALEVASSATLKNSGKLAFSGPFSLNSASAYHYSGYFGAASIRIGYGGQFFADNKVVSGDIVVSQGGVITHDAGHFNSRLEALRDIVVEYGGRISADGKGYGSDGGPGKPFPGSGCSNGAGGGYGGAGGDTGGIKGGLVYGAPLIPDLLGSGGGASVCGGSGGGAGGGRLDLAAGGRILVNGSISANGEKGGFAWCYSCSYVGGGGGSGGAVLLKADSIEGAGSITADGGRGGAGNNGGGGGGRIGLYYTSKPMAGTLTANGGPAGGKPGTIFENGAVKAGDPPGIDAVSAIAKPAEILGSQNYISETLASGYMRLTGVRSTGSISGVFNFPELEIVRVRTGAFNGRGFASGGFSASLGGADYSGELKAAVYEKDGALYLKGALSGDVRGVIEAAAGNGVFSGKVKFSGVGSQNSAGELSLSGAAAEIPGAQYPGTRLRHVQSNVAGDMSGYLYYSGALNSVLDYLNVDDPANPYYGKGFLTGSFKGRLGEAQGFAYAEGQSSGLAGFAGMIGAPSYGRLGGVYMGNSDPRAFALSFERIDAGLPYGMELTLKVIGPGKVSPGQAISYTVELSNNGLADAENISIIAMFPPHMDFISASGNYKFYDMANWINTEYAPVPFLKWDLAKVPAKSVQKLTFQGSVRIPGPEAHELIEGEAFVVSRETAEALLPVCEPADYIDPPEFY